MSRKIVVEITSKRTESPLPEAIDTNNLLPAPDGSKSGGEENDGTYALSKFAAYQITKNVIASINTEIGYYLGKYTELTEDYKTGVNISNAKTVISTIGGIFGSTLAGGIAGAKFGPVGMIVGAVAGMSSSFVASAISSKNTYNEAIADIHENVYSNYFYSLKAGYADGSRGTEN
jgi:hypothetical protein